MVHWRFKQLASIASAPLVSDVIIISGFWRSGTTWLQQQVADAARAKTIFEPYSPACGHIWEQLDANSSVANQHTFMPLGMDHLTASDIAVLKKSLRGVGTHGYTYFLFNKLSDILARRLVVKFTRIGNLLPEIHSLFSGPVLHIRRHPGAVYASFKNTDWEWSFNDVRLAGNYPMQGVGEAEKALIGMLNKHDKTPATRFAALWGASEMKAHEAVEASKAVLIEYSDLIDNNIQIVEILENFGIEALSPASSNKISPVTTADRQKLTSAQRKHDWKERLDVEEIADIRSTLEDIFPKALELYEL